MKTKSIITAALFASSLMASAQTNIPLVYDAENTNCIDSQRPEVEAFVDKFLLGKKTKTNITALVMFEKVDYKKWWKW